MTWPNGQISAILTRRSGSDPRCAAGTGERARTCPRSMYPLRRLVDLVCRPPGCRSVNAAPVSGRFPDGFGAPLGRTVGAVRSRNEQGESGMRTCLTVGVLAAVVGLAGCGGSNSAMDLPPVGERERWFAGLDRVGAEAGRVGPVRIGRRGRRVRGLGCRRPGAGGAGRAERWVAIFPGRRGRSHGRRGVGARGP